MVVCVFADCNWFRCIVDAVVASCLMLVGVGVCCLLVRCCRCAFVTVAAGLRLLLFYVVAAVC